MTSKDEQAREKAKAVEKRVGPLVTRTGAVEASVSTLQSQISTLQSQISTLQSQVATLNSSKARMAALGTMGSQTIGSGSPAANQGNVSGAFSNTATHINAILNCW